MGNETKKHSRHCGGAAACLLVAVFVLAGCATPQREFYFPRFSPDGTMVAWLEQQASRTPLLVRQQVRLCWRDVAERRAVHAVDIAAVLPTFNDPPIAWRTHYAFSPAGRQVAAASPAGLQVIDLAEGRIRRLSAPRERITSFAWVGDDRIVYVAQTRRLLELSSDLLNADLWDRTVWRQRVDGREPRRSVWQEQAAATGAGDVPVWPLEHFSPDGQRLLLSSPYADGQFQLLDLDDGSRIAFGSSSGPASLVAWKPDSSAAVVVGGAWPVSAWLVDAAGGQISDISNPFRKAFGEYPPMEMPGFAGDGRLIVNDAGRRGCLVRLDPWQVTPVGRTMLSGLEIRLDRNDGFLWPVPGSGRLVLAGRETDLFLVDGGTLRSVPLAGAQYPEHVAVSPDGRSFALAAQQRVDVYPIDWKADGPDSPLAVGLQ